MFKIGKSFFEKQNVDALYTRAIHGHSGGEHFSRIFSRGRSSSQAVRKSSSISTTQSTKKNIEETGRRLRSETKVHNQCTSRLSTPWTKERTNSTRPTNTLMSVHDAIYVVDMEGAHNKNLKFDRALNDCIVSFDTIPENHMKKAIHIRDI